MKYIKKRWDIEVFFKLLKSNFKFRDIRETKEININKLIFIELIIILITKILKIYHFSKIKSIKSININKIKINESNLLKGYILVYFVCKYMFRDLHIILSKLTKDIIDNFTRTYILQIKNGDNRSFERVSLRTFSKWLHTRKHRM